MTMKHTVSALLIAPSLAAAAPALAACPATTFDGFLAAFSESAAVQRQYTANPLTTHTIDPAAEPEPRMVTNRLPLNAVRMPIMPGKAERKRDGLLTKTAPQQDGTMGVKLAKADTGYQLLYRFRREGTCWQLIEYTDESL
jgi:hypothetical protein